MAHSPTNLLLEALPLKTKESLMRLLEPLELPLRTVLFEAQAAPKYIHFITSGLASVVTVMSGGDAVEVGFTSREGLAEKVHLLGPQTGMTRCFMQIAGTGLRMDFLRFKELFSRDLFLHRAVLRLVQFEALVLAQLAACNRLHDVEERLARWILMVADRTGKPDMQLTQEFLGEMLGARRSTVNIALGSLQKAGLIEYRRSYIRIESRQNLEDVACECYPIIRKLLLELYNGLPKN